jgi:hypothetical protein
MMAQSIWWISSGDDFPHTEGLNEPPRPAVVQPYPYGPRPGKGNQGIATGFWPMSEPPRFLIDLRHDTEFMANRENPDSPLLLGDACMFARDTSTRPQLS